MEGGGGWFVEAFNIALQKGQQRSNLKQLFECPSQHVEKERVE
jgi:hypothetical protein